MTKLDLWEGSMTKTRNLLLGVVFLASAAGAWAQNVAGTILGAITDASGAAVTSAMVTVVNEETNIEYKAASETGEFVAPNLAAGTYTVRTELAGFRPNVVKGVRLLAGRTARVDVMLE